MPSFSPNMAATDVSVWSGARDRREARDGRRDCAPHQAAIAANLRAPGLPISQMRKLRMQLDLAAMDRQSTKWTNR